MSQAMRKVTANASKCGCTVIMLNQLRQKIGIMFGNPEVTSGGQALKFYASVRIDVRRKATIEGTKGEMVGIKVKAKVTSLFQGALLPCDLNHMLKSNVCWIEVASCYGSSESALLK